MKKRLSIMTPTRDGLVDINYCSSLIESVKSITDWEISPSIISGASDIVGARNAMFNAWYYKTDVEAMMWIDSDIAWHPNDLKRWLGLECGVIAGNYAKKKFKPLSFLQSAQIFQQTNGYVDPEQALRASYDYVSTGAHNKIIAGEFEGLYTVGGIGMGFFLLHREAADILVDYAEENYPEMKAKFYTLGQDNPIMGYPFFNTIIGEDGTSWGEDYSFCRRLKEAGISIFMDPNVALRHGGYTTFDSNFSEQLKTVQAVRENPNLVLPEGQLTINQEQSAEIKA